MQNTPNQLRPYLDATYSVIVNTATATQGQSNLHRLIYNSLMQNGGNNQIAKRSLEFALAFIYILGSQGKVIDQNAISNAGQFGLIMTMYELLNIDTNVRQYANQDQLQKAGDLGTRNQIVEYSNAIAQLFNGQMGMSGAVGQMPQQLGAVGLMQNNMPNNMSNNNMAGMSLGFSGTQNNNSWSQTTQSTPSLTEMGSLVSEQAKNIIFTPPPPKQKEASVVSAPVQTVVPTEPVIKTFKPVKKYFQGSDMDRSAHTLTFGQTTFNISQAASSRIEVGVDMMKIARPKNEDVLSGDSISLDTNVVEGTLVDAIADICISATKKKSPVYRAFADVYSHVVTTTSRTDMIEKLSKHSTLSGLFAEQKRLALSVQNLSASEDMKDTVRSAMAVLLAINESYNCAVKRVMGIYEDALLRHTPPYILDNFNFSTDIEALVTDLQTSLIKDSELQSKILTDLEEAVCNCAMFSEVESAEMREGYVINKYFYPALITVVDADHVEFGYNIGKEWSIISSTTEQLLYSLARSSMSHIESADVAISRMFIATTDLHLYEYTRRFNNEFIIRNVSYLLHN